MAIDKIGSAAITDCTVVAADIAPGTITNAKLAGSIANAKLANSSVTINGTSISLGASGSIPAVSWQSVVTSDGSTVTTMVAGRGYFVDNTSAAGLVKLPASASAGDTVAIKDYAGNFGTNNLTIQRNSHNIQGVANDSVIQTNRASVTLVYVDATKGWLYANESNVAVLYPEYVTATGGTVTTVNTNFKVHTFTGDGCFVVSNAGNSNGSTQVDYLVIGGGGAGGSGYAAGGGGAGGYRESSGGASGCYTISPLGACVSAITVSAQTYPITVGAGGGGPAGPPCNGIGNSGSNSIFSTITSAGGGGGNGGAGTPAPGSDGASGGGAGNDQTTKGSGNVPPVSPPQGNPGGNSGGPGSGNTAGGGGGATAAGGAGTRNSNGGAGGAGGTSSINGTPTARAGGGGGGVRTTSATNGTGGSGGGGIGGGSSTPGSNSGAAATANTGSGGGGGGHPSGSPGPGGAGGKGIVIIRYKFQN